MKRVLMFIMVFTVLSGTSLIAEKGSANIFGGIGFAFSDLEGIAIHLGGEMAFTDNIWGQVVIDYLPSPFGDLPDGVSASTFNFGLFAMYKHALNEKTNLFGKAGLIYNSNSVSGTAFGFTAVVNESGIGFGGGAGVDLKLDEKKAITVGADIYSREEALWVKIYAGFSLKVK